VSGELRREHPTDHRDSLHDVGDCRRGVVTILGGWLLSMGVTFDEFAESAGPRLRHALVAAYGLDVGVDAAAEAMAYGFERWDDVAETANPAGYLYRVGQTAARRLRRRPGRLPRPEPSRLPDVEPGLVPAHEELTETQRLVVVLVVGLQWRQSEVADLLDVSHSTVRTHLDRAMTQLRTLMEVPGHV
jgi:DNA-directed RNA polymerase specialized sigma24 family protein